MARLMIATLLIAVLVFGLWWINTRGDLVHEAPFPSPSDVVSSDHAHRFVGTAACIGCHTQIADRHSTSGHADTFHITADSDLAKRLNGVEFEDTLRKNKFQYHFDRGGLSVSLPSVFGDERFPLSYALGSGAHGVTFLTLLPHRDGSTIGLEHRVTYYHQKAGLDLTVGHPFLGEPVEDVEHFGRVLTGQKLTKCIECHTTSGRVENMQIQNLIPHVGCERCHGPGSGHVANMNAGLKDPDFGTAQRWPTAMAELRTCGACHRLPESLKKSELMRESKVLPRFQPAGLMQSLCFQNSNGAMRCTTCHDPHGKVSTDTGRYEKICLDCHGSQSKSVCQTSSTNCIQCHMPPVSLEGVASFHDHWIRVRNENDPSAELSKTVPGH